MASFTLDEVQAAFPAVVLQTQQNKFCDIVTDTRFVKKGVLFVALTGEKFDGHDFLQAAIENGAAGVLVSRKYSEAELRDLPVTVIQAADTLTAYQLLAKVYRRRFSIPVIAITGSNGKTTTKDFTAAVLSAKFNVLKTEANFNNEIGLPKTLLQLKANHQAAVVEMGMRGFGQIAELAEIAQPTIGIVTNVGETHMELLGSLANIAKAKAELVEHLDESSVVILNADNPFVAAMQTKVKGKCVTFGIEKISDLRAGHIKTVHKNCTEFDCTFKGKTDSFVLPIVGRHNVYNVLAALAVGFTLGLSAVEMQKGLTGFAATKMRFEIQQVGLYQVINDAYNASPMSMKAALETLAEVAEKRKIAVLGDMLELGSVSVEAHKNIGKLVADQKIDALITFGDMAAHIAQEARTAGVKLVYTCNSHAEAGKVLNEILQPDDTILFKGSRGMQMEKIIDLI
jgi:UDP-N-acetylmuramoyl-tripeptide--D-alanyl-D-alanine ligase